MTELGLRIELRRRIGFWLDHNPVPLIGCATARLISDDVLVTDVCATRRGNKRWWVRISLVKSKGIHPTARYAGTNHFLRMRIHPRQRRETIASLPPLLVWRLCKNRRWYARATHIELPYSVMDDR